MKIRVINSSDNTVSCIDMDPSIPAKDIPYYVTIETKGTNIENIQYVYNAFDKIKSKELSNELLKIVIDSNPEKIMSIIIKNTESSELMLNNIVHLLITNNVKIQDNIKYDLKILKKYQEKKESCA